MSSSLLQEINSWRVKNKLLSPLINLRGIVLRDILIPIYRTHSAEDEESSEVDRKEVCCSGLKIQLDISAQDRTDGQPDPKYHSPFAQKISGTQ